MLGTTLLADYLNHVRNKSFHDLTDGNKIPPAAFHILGLGLKFIPTPNKVTSVRDIEPSLDRLSRNVELKCFYAADDNEMPKTKLRISSEWRPPYSTLEADRRLSTFSRSVRALFSSKRAVKQNLSSFHRTLLDTIRSDDSIVYTNADKGLGLAGVELQKYIGWGLKHLTDTTTYRIIPEEAEAWADIHTLRDDIL